MLACTLTLLPVTKVVPTPPAYAVSRTADRRASREHDFPQVQLFPHRANPSAWFSVNRPHLVKHCRTAWERITVEANGDVIVCPDNSDTIIGNVRHESIHSIWNSEKVQRVRSYLTKNLEYPACRFCTYAYLDRDAKVTLDWRKNNRMSS